MWAEDSKISQASLDETSRVTPMLHAKYLELRATSKLQLKRAEMAQKILLKDKFLYYNGKMAKEEMEEARNKLAEAEQARRLLLSKTVVNTKFPS